MVRVNAIDLNRPYSISYGLRLPCLFDAIKLPFDDGSHFFSSLSMTNGGMSIVSSFSNLQADGNLFAPLMKGDSPIPYN
ncbi:hypothetical protein BLOT_012759 [Blomia tropicalis]|nr:hypothetical protein BLOT_012759 [Blomia tropicalis]